MANKSVQGFYFHRPMEAAAVTKLLLKEKAERTGTMRARKGTSRGSRRK